MKLSHKLLIKIVLAGILSLNVNFIGNLATTFAEPANNAPASEEVTAPDQITALTPISYFGRVDCTHCQELKEFLNNLNQDRQDFEIIYHDIANQNDNDLFQEFTQSQKLSRVTPIILVGNTVIQGFESPETTGQRITKLLDQSQGKKTLSIEEFLQNQEAGLSIEKVSNGTCDESGLTPCTVEENADEYSVNVPFYGPVSLKEFSLVSLSAILGFVDGFNPCAMWVLMTFLLILIDAGSRKKMWQLAGIFILAEAVMYYLILNVWFTTWDFVQLNSVVTPIVALVAIAAGSYFLYEWKTSDGSCKVTNAKQKAKTRQKIKSLVEKDINFISIFGILGIAFSVNIIEFACSVGIPQTFTKVIELNNLSFWATQFYMAIYILMYMIDDLIVFGIALYSFERIGLTSKYTKFSHLVGGGLMIILGFILLFKPEWLIV